MYLRTVTCYYLRGCACLSHVSFPRVTCHSHVSFPRVTCHCHVPFPRVTCQSSNHLTIGRFRGGYHSPWSWQGRMSLALPSSNWRHVGRGRCHELRSRQYPLFRSLLRLQRSYPLFRVLSRRCGFLSFVKRVH